MKAATPCIYYQWAEEEGSSGVRMYIYIYIIKRYGCVSFCTALSVWHCTVLSRVFYPGIYNELHSLTTPHEKINQ